MDSRMSCCLFLMLRTEIVKVKNMSIIIFATIYFIRKNFLREVQSFYFAEKWILLCKIERNYDFETLLILVRVMYLGDGTYEFIILVKSSHGDRCRSK